MHDYRRQHLRLTARLPCGDRTSYQLVPPARSRSCQSLPRCVLFGAMFTVLFAFPFFWLVEMAQPALLTLAVVLAMVLGWRRCTRRRQASSPSCSTRGCDTAAPRSARRSQPSSPEGSHHSSPKASSEAQAALDRSLYTSSGWRQRQWALCSWPVRLPTRTPHDFRVTVLPTVEVRVALQG